MKHQLERISHVLDQAAHKVKAIDQLNIQEKYTLDQSYTIQKMSINQRIERGEEIVGYKLGFTSKAKMEQMGVHEIIWGRLTDLMHIENGSMLPSNRFIHPRAEPEVAFLVKKKISNALAKQDLSAHISHMAAAIEIIDSRYKNFKFSLEDVVADNCSSSGYVIGDWIVFSESLDDLSIEMNINDHQTLGNTKAILGDPINSLVAISELTEKYDFQIKAGQGILAGAATAAQFIHPGDQVQADFQSLGTISFRVI